MKTADVQVNGINQSYATGYGFRDNGLLLEDADGISSIVISGQSGYIALAGMLLPMSDIAPVLKMDNDNGELDFLLEHVNPVFQYTLYQSTNAGEYEEILEIKAIGSGIIITVKSKIHWRPM